jgi:ABC-type Na+ efflux pump permease subunit
LTREKRQHTLEVLLASKVKMKYIIIGKILPVLLIAILFQFVEIGFMLGLLTYKGSSLVPVFSIQSLLIMPFIYYIMNAIILIIGVVINDDKVSDMIGILVAMIVGASLLYIANFLAALTVWHMFLIVCIVLFLLSFLFTYICEWILIKSMLFIKI